MPTSVVLMLIALGLFVVGSFTTALITRTRRIVISVGLLIAAVAAFVGGGPWSNLLGAASLFAAVVYLVPLLRRARTV